jgi:hypothetical protein
MDFPSCVASHHHHQVAEMLQGRFHLMVWDLHLDPAVPSADGHPPSYVIESECSVLWESLEADA